MDEKRRQAAALPNGPVSRASASGERICGAVWGESRRPSWRGLQSRVAQAGEWAALVQVASCAASSELAGIAVVRWTAGRAEWAQVASWSEWAGCRAVKVGGAERAGGRGRGWGEGRGKGRSADRRSAERAGAHS